MRRWRGVLKPARALRVCVVALALGAALIASSAQAQAQSCRGPQGCGPLSVCSVSALGECRSSGMLAVCEGSCMTGVTWRVVTHAGAAMRAGDDQARLAPALSVEVMPPVLRGGLGVELGAWGVDVAHADVNLTAQAIPEELRVGGGGGATLDRHRQAAGYRAYGRLTWTAWSLLRGLTFARFVALTLDVGAVALDTSASPAPQATLSVDGWF